MKNQNDVFTLKNGYGIPCIGYGTYQTPDGEAAARSVKTAIESGYRHIDAAFIYENEKGVGQGIAEGMESTGVKREELFITGKVWNDDRGYDSTMSEFEQSLKDLRLEYLDLYLIHWPAVPHQFENWREINKDTWRALIGLYKAGRVKAIGVSNFRPYHLKDLMEMEVQPMVNQIEFHPGQIQHETLEFCRENGMQVEAYSPLGTGEMLNQETIIEIAKKYGKSPAQICLRWVLQNGVLPLAKSVTPSRIKENLQIFDFEISPDDMQTINFMPYCGGSGITTENVDF